MSCKLKVWKFWREIQLPNFHHLYVPSWRSRVYTWAIVLLLDNGPIGFLNLNLLFLTFRFSFPTTAHIWRVQNRPFTLRPVAFYTIKFGGKICGSTETKPITRACHKVRHIAVTCTNDTDKTTLQNSSRHRNTRSKPTSLTIVEVQVLCVTESRTYKYEVMNMQIRGRTWNNKRHCKKHRK